MWNRQPSVLQARQTKLHAQWAANFQDYLRNKMGDTEAVIDGSWPAYPRD